MSLPNYLARIKSSGIYRFVWDKSVVPTQVAETLRLVVGYSDKGPFNTPVYIDNASDFINIYGDVSKKMERKGIYFNRLAILALLSAPILALNLKPFTTESVKYITFNNSGADSSIKTITTEDSAKDMNVLDLYDRNRFWVLDENQLPSKIGRNAQYMSISATDTKDASCTLFMRQVSPENNKGFDMSIRDWFSSNQLDMPEYLAEIQDENLANSFVEIYVFKGQFTKDLCLNNGSLSEYFITDGGNGFKLKPEFTNAFGEKVDALDALTQDSNSNFINKYKGTTLPYFKDGNGNYISLDILFNSDHSLHKMLMKLNEGYLYDNIGEGNNIKEALLLDAADMKTTSFNEYYTVNTNIIEKRVNDITKEINTITPTIASNNAILNADVEKFNETNPEVASLLRKVNDSLYGNLSKADATTYVNAKARILSYQPTPAGEMSVQVTNSKGKKSNVMSDNPKTIEKELDQVLINQNALKSDNLIVSEFESSAHKEFSDEYLKLSSIVTNISEMEKVKSEKIALNKSQLILVNKKSTLEAEKTELEIKKSDLANDKAANQDTYQDMNDTDFTGKYGSYPVATAENVYLSGYTYVSLNNSSVDLKMKKDLPLQKAILDVLTDKGIYTALTNRIDVEYRYIVDTFRGYIELGCKAKLAAITKAKDNAFAILNFPPMEDFVNDSKFTSNVTGKFDIKELSNKSNGFTLASEIEGASWCGYFTSVKFSDGAQKSYIPSAALVSNNFMEKYGARQPYYIVAGPNYGRINYSGMVGPDYNYGRTDLDVLEPMGVNAIIYVPRKGTFINSNQTAKQTPVSGLSKIHIRELVIYLQDEIEAMLLDYQWELNTQTLRDTIKAKADVICERVMNNGGLYAFTNVCDESNNTPEVIDNEMIILDTAIEPARGAGKMVQTLTIHKTGGITSK